MPKKTKKEKIIAEYRKKIKLLQLSQSNQGTVSIQKQSVKLPTVPSPAVKEQYRYTEEDKKITHYFTQDLKKSLLLIGSIIALEILLYFVSINTNLRLGR